MSKKTRKAKGVKLDGKGPNAGSQETRKHYKTQKIRSERRAAKADPETQPLYGKFGDYLT